MASYSTYLNKTKPTNPVGDPTKNRPKSRFKKKIDVGLGRLIYIICSA